MKTLLVVILLVGTAWAGKREKSLLERVEVLEAQNIELTKVINANAEILQGVVSGPKTFCLNTGNMVVCK
jgi:hypothetical protein